MDTPDSIFDKSDIIFSAAAGFAFGTVIGAKYLSDGKKPARKPGKLLLAMTFDFFTIKTHNTMAVEAFVGQKSTLKVKALDRKGRDARVDSVTFENSNPGAVKITQNPDDKMEATLEYIGIGVATVAIKVDADLDAGEDQVRYLEDFVAIEVKEEEAVGFGIEVSDPVDVETTPESGGTNAGPGTTAP